MKCPRCGNVGPCPQCEPDKFSGCMEATVPREIADRLAEAVEKVVRCLDGIHPGGREGEPLNPLAVMADRAIADKAIRSALAEYRKAVG